VDLVSQQQSDERRHADILPLELHDHDGFDRSRLRRILYEVQQCFRYRYAAPICNLRQRLVVVPRTVHGNQRLLSHRLEVSQSRSRKRMRFDQFDNVIFGISIAEVEETVEVALSLIAERLTGQGTQLETATRQAVSLRGACAASAEGLISSRGRFQEIGAVACRSGRFSRSAAASAMSRADVQQDDFVVVHPTERLTRVGFIVEAGEHGTIPDLHERPSSGPRLRLCRRTAPSVLRLLSRRRYGNACGVVNRLLVRRAAKVALQRGEHEDLPVLAGSLTQVMIELIQVAVSGRRSCHGGHLSDRCGEVSDQICSCRE